MIALEDMFGSFEGKPAAKDRALCEGIAFCVVEEIPRPVDGSAQCGLSGGNALAGVGEDVETLLKTLEEGLWREDVDACCGKFDGKGQTVEVLDDLFDDTEFLFEGLPTRAKCAGAIQKELDGLIIGKGREWECTFADKLEFFARGNKEADEAFFLGPAADGGEGVWGELLEIIKDDQGLSATMQRIADLVDVLFDFARLEGDAKGLCDALEHFGEGVTFAEVAEPDAAVEMIELLEAKVLCKTGFSRPTGAKEGDQAFALCEGIADILDFLVTSNEAFLGWAEVGFLELGPWQTGELCAE